MKQKTLFDIKKLVEDLYGNLEPFKFYDIKQLGLQIEIPGDSFADVVSFVVKPGFRSIVELEDDTVVIGSHLHPINTPGGSFMIKDLKKTDRVTKRDGSSIGIREIIVSENEQDFYDIEVDTQDHLYVTADGVVHHNTGKTHTVEAILAEMGLRDGQGYFKNTGSASAAGIYSLLFRHKNDVILFDDSDSAFGDQDARNIFKAATDTKKVRKLVWNKMGKNIADPEEMTDDEILNNDMIPRYFEFTGKVIAISNLPLNKLDPDGALRTRGYIINIDPTDMEIYDFMEKIVDKMPLEDGLTLDLASRKHVVDLLRKGKSRQSPNLRKLCRGLNLYAGACIAGVSVSDADLQRMIETYA